MLKQYLVILLTTKNSPGSSKLKRLCENYNQNMYKNTIQLSYIELEDQNVYELIESDIVLADYFLIESIDYIKRRISKHAILDFVNIGSLSLQDEELLEDQLESIINLDKEQKKRLNQKDWTLEEYILTRTLWNKY
ncbi:hypothetical protein [Marinilactibacillus sp. Marseille-P9653]|uniref:hypothetical protein n=1 Tax=Marinilactibacillus sp. Marseille-P9653 TaxID=2866583 RepID=UPI001CE4876E|nr:hypothetical protein [Marinilactibacillus sp. Marseille-P9653]